MGLFLNARMAPGTPLWLPTPQETEAIAMPLGRIAARHAPMDTGTATDLSDAAEAVVATVGYGVRNLSMGAAMRGTETPQPAPPPAATAEAADPGPSPHDRGPGSVSIDVDDDGPVSPAADGPAVPGFHDVFPPGFGG